MRLETLDRRTAETLEQTSAPPAAKDAPEFVVSIAEDEQPKEDLKSLAGLKGWRRSHRHKIYDSLKTGYQQEPQQNVAPKFVTIHGELSVFGRFPSIRLRCLRPPPVLHTSIRNTVLTLLLHVEFDDESYVESAEFKAAAEGKKEVRRWKLYKATPNTANA